MTAATADPTRMHVVNLTTGEDLEVQYNPEDLSLLLEVDYARLDVPGLSHQPMQYSSTKNVVSKFSLYCAAHSTAQRERIDDFTRFLSSLCYAPEGARSVGQGAPPRVLFVWPRLATMTTRITSLQFKFATFAKDGGAIRWTADVSLEEARDVRLTMEDVRVAGFRRPVSGPSDPAG